MGGTTLFNMQNACNFLLYNLKFQRSQRAVPTDTKNVSIEYTHTHTHTNKIQIYYLSMRCGICNELWEMPAKKEARITAKYISEILNRIENGERRRERQVEKVLLPILSL